MRRIATGLFLLIMLAGCGQNALFTKSDCWREDPTTGVVHCKKVFFSCPSGWHTGKPPAPLQCP